MPKETLIINFDLQSTRISILALIAFSYIIMFWSVQYAGEESVYTIMSYEMYVNKTWLTPTLYGEPYWRPPLFNWLIILLSMLMGWEQSLAAARIISALATFASSGLIYWIVKRVWEKEDMAFFSSLIYLCFGQVLFGYGWKSYSDALFGTFTLSAMLFGWLAVKETTMKWLAIALITALLGFLTKALTVFIFLGLTIIISVFAYRNLKFILSLKSLSLCLITGLSVIGWYKLAPAGADMSSGMLSDIIDKVINFNWNKFFLHSLSFPVKTFFLMSPFSLIFIFYLHNKKHGFYERHKDTAIIGLIAFLNFIPYWLAPHGHDRYLMPLYGLAAIYFGVPMFYSEPVRKISGHFFVYCVLMKLLFAAIFYPFYTKHFQPNAQEIADDIILITADKPLYFLDDTWIGIAVADRINISRLKNSHVVKPPKNFKEGYVVISYKNASFGKVIKSYGGKTFLHCKGSFCEH